VETWILALRPAEGPERAERARRWRQALDALSRHPAVAGCSGFEAEPSDALLARGRREARPSRLVGLAALEVADVAAGAELLALAAAGGGLDAWATERVVHWDALGAVGAAVVMLCLVRRRPDLLAGEFRERYREHARVARVHHPGVARYAQSFVVRALTRHAPPADAFAELHFASERDLRERFYRDAASPDVVARDVARFLDPGRTLAVAARPRRPAPAAAGAPIAPGAGTS